MKQPEILTDRPEPKDCPCWCHSGKYPPQHLNSRDCPTCHGPSMTPEFEARVAALEASA